ncbi:MAG: hypothetical protein JRI92_07350 [Deltaproteobacteria bacterium]|nr:hypothetical protein [Deltaproteobacteria bacterium]
MNSYHKEQTEVLTMVKRHLDNLPASERQALSASVADYLISCTCSTARAFCGLNKGPVRVEK